MKTITRIVCMAALAMMAAIPLSAQSNSQARIRSLLRVYYIPNPNVATGEVLIDPDEFLNSSMAGLSERRNAVFQSLLTQLWGPSGRDALALQTVVGEILTIRNRRIAIYLVDDANTIPNVQAGLNRWGIALADGRTWPAGGACNTQSNASPADRCQVFAGSFTLGNWHLTNTFLADTDEIAATFCHELMHTQDVADWRTHLPGLSNLYGFTSDDHPSSAAIPNMAMAYAEGLANFAAFRYPNFGRGADALSADAAMRWFVANDLLQVETTPQYGDLYMRMRAITPARTETSRHAGPPARTVTWALYPIRSVPAPVRIHNELIIGLILHHYATQIGFHSTMRTVARVTPQNYLVSTIPLSNLIGGLVSDATGNVRLLPIALVDYFTSYTANTPDEMRAILEGPLSGAANAEIERYYTTVRQPIRDATGPSRIDPNAPSAADVINIASRLGIRSTPRD